jgi:aryl carrier-like protein
MCVSHLSSTYCPCDSYNVQKPDCSALRKVGPACPLNVLWMQEHAASVLHPSKWPQLLVYMDGGLPVTSTGKITRVNMAQRLGLPQISDSGAPTSAGVAEDQPGHRDRICLQPLTRLFEAATPAKGTPVQSPITCRAIDVETEAWARTCAVLRQAAAGAVLPSACSLEDVGVATKWKGSSVELCAFLVDSAARSSTGISESRQQPAAASASSPSQLLLDVQKLAALLRKCDGCLPDYLLPTQVVQVEELQWAAAGDLPSSTPVGLVSRRLLPSWVDAQWGTAMDGSVSSALLACVLQAMASVLGVKPECVDPAEDFFALGGDSIKSGRLVGQLRRSFPDVHSMQARNKTNEKQTAHWLACNSFIGTFVMIISP